MGLSFLWVGGQHYSWLTMDLLFSFNKGLVKTILCFFYLLLALIGEWAGILCVPHTHSHWGVLESGGSFLKLPPARPQQSSSAKCPHVEDIWPAGLHVWIGSGMVWGGPHAIFIDVGFPLNPYQTRVCFLWVFSNAASFDYILLSAGESPLTAGRTH